MAWTNPRTWLTGEVLTAALLNTHLRDNLLELNGATSGWAVWAPELTNLAGTVTAKYKQIGKLVVCECFVVLTAVPTGNFQIAPPVAVKTKQDVLSVGTAMSVVAAGGSSLGSVEFPVSYNGLIGIRGPGVGIWGAATPGVWAANDQFGFTAVYEAA